MTFLPPNERVENQNVGRTARTGNRGTAQFIVIDQKSHDFSELKAARNYFEEKEIGAANGQISKTLIKDEVFKLFCKLLTHTENQFDRRAVEERFGIWLQMRSEKAKNLHEEYLKFAAVIMDDLSDKKVIKNPCYYVLHGNKHLDKNKKEHYELAIENYTKAIELDKEFSENAYYNRAYTKLKLYCDDVSNKKSEIQSIIDDFEECRKKIKNREIELHVIQQASAREKNMLSEQVIRKAVMHVIQKRAIEHAIGYDKESYDQIIFCLEKQKKDAIAEFEELQKNNSKLDNSEITKHQEFLRTIDKKIKDFIESDPMTGEIEKALSEGADMEIEGFEIRKSFPAEENVKLFDDEIQEFSTNGFRGKFKIKKIAPIDW